jgi:hypothetical protein
MFNSCLNDTQNIKYYIRSFRAFCLSKRMELKYSDLNNILDRLN